MPDAIMCTFDSVHVHRGGTTVQLIHQFVLFCRPGVPHASLEGLTEYSHCWILYVFHRNTDLHDLWNDSDRGIKAKVHVPKLNGKRTGLFATRSPHRPNPIGKHTSAYHLIPFRISLDSMFSWAGKVPGFNLLNMHIMPFTNKPPVLCRSNGARQRRVVLAVQDLLC